MCFEINGLKNLKLTILRFLPGPPIYVYYYTGGKNLFIVKSAWIHIIFILIFWNIFFKETIYLGFIVVFIFMVGNLLDKWEMRNEKWEIRN